MTKMSPHPLLFLILFLVCGSLLPLTATAASKGGEIRKNEQGGIGLQVVPVASGEIVVIAVLAKSPAAQAKLLPGDLIISVDGDPLRGSNFAEVTKNRLWGKAGSKVRITWLRPGVAGKKSAELVRRALKNDPPQELEVKMLLPAPAAPSAETKP